MSRSDQLRSDRQPGRVYPNDKPSSSFTSPLSGPGGPSKTIELHLYTPGQQEDHEERDTGPRRLDFAALQPSDPRWRLELRSIAPSAQEYKHARLKLRRKRTKTSLPWVLRHAHEGRSLEDIGRNITGQNEWRQAVQVNYCIRREPTTGKPFLDVTLTPISHVPPPSNAQPDTGDELRKDGIVSCVYDCQATHTHYITFRDIRVILAFLVGGLLDGEEGAVTIFDEILKRAKYEGKPSPRDKNVIPKALNSQDPSLELAGLQEQIRRYGYPRGFGGRGEGVVYEWKDLEACLDYHLRRLEIVSPLFSTWRATIEPNAAPAVTHIRGTSKVVVPREPTLPLQLETSESSGAEPESVHAVAQCQDAGSFQGLPSYADLLRSTGLRDDEDI